MHKPEKPATYFGKKSDFPVTQWTQIENKGHSKDLKTDLYQHYSAPLYAYLCRKGYSRDDAADYVQGFLSEILFGRDFLSKADRERGKFRSLLLTSLTHYVNMSHRKKKIKPSIDIDSLVQELPESIPQDPSQAFDIAWATQTLDRALADLEQGCKQNDRLTTHWLLFQQRVVLPILNNTPPPSLPTLCSQLDIQSEQHASNMIATVKRRFNRVLERHLPKEPNDNRSFPERLQEFVRLFSKFRK